MSILPTDPNVVQRRASKPEASVWVAANAGTGKTKVLTERVLALLLCEARAHEILCLTFTKAAAAEMSNRISDKLSDWTSQSDEDLTQELSALLERPPSPSEFARARQLFAEILDAPGGLNIQTIHGFCQSLLKRFPLEAGLAPHFQVMEERTTQEYLKQARDQVMMDARLGRVADLHDALNTVSRHVHETNFGDLLVELSKARSKIRTLLQDHGGVRKLVLRLYEIKELQPGDTKERLIERACEQESFDALGMRYLCEALGQGSPANQKSQVTVSNWLAGSQEERVQLMDDYMGFFLTKDDNIKNIKSMINKAAREANPAAEDILMVEAARMLRLTDQIKSAQMIEATGALLRLGKALVDSYEDIKKRQAVLDFDDLILQARRLLSEERVPWVLYKLDGGISHILVDEAQDTNPDQWQVVEALSRDFFSGLGAHEDKSPRTVFAVGDIKQSIYGFQGADPGEFERVKSVFAHQVPAAGQIWDEVPMTVSFRSTRAVLEAVDRVFAPQNVSQGVEPNGPMHHEAWRAEEGGLVELWPPVKPLAESTPQPWKPPVERHEIDSPRAKLAGLIARRIHAMVEGREILEAKGRAIRPGDIMVLVRQRSGFVEELVRELKVLDIAVAGVDRMVLSQQMAVMDLLALGRFLLQPDDDLQLACVLKGPLVGLNEEDLFDLAYKRKSTLWSVLRDRAKSDLHYHQAYTFLSGLMALTDYVRPFELFSHILNTQEGRRKIVRRLGIEAHDPLNEFLDLALNFEQSHAPALETFLAWVEGDEIEVKRDLEQGNQDAVRIMTVHGSKGLQAPIVFLPDTMGVPKFRQNIFWPRDEDDRAGLFLWAPKAGLRDSLCDHEVQNLKQKQQEEYRRLLYVAMTRAEDRLYISGYEGRRSPPEDCWYNLLRAGMESLCAPVEDAFLKSEDLFDHPEVLRHESAQLKTPKETAQEKSNSPEALDLPDWARSSPKNEPHPPRPLAPSRPSEMEPASRSPLGEDRGQRYRRGNIIHALLQTLPDLREAERAAALKRYLGAPAQKLNAKQQDEIYDEVMAVLDDPHFHKVFGPGSTAEVPLVGEVGGRVISAQMDRLLVTEDEVLVVDYKTNRPPPRTVKKVPKIYRQQMRAYRDALRLIYPDKTVRCALLWTDAARLMALPDEVLDA